MPHLGPTSPESFTCAANRSDWCNHWGVTPVAVVATVHRTGSSRRMSWPQRRIRVPFISTALFSLAFFLSLQFLFQSEVSPFQCRIDTFRTRVSACRKYPSDAVVGYCLDFLVFPVNHMLSKRFVEPLVQFSTCLVDALPHDNRSHENRCDELCVHPRELLAHLERKREERFDRVASDARENVDSCVLEEFHCSCVWVAECDELLVHRVHD